MDRRLQREASPQGVADEISSRVHPLYGNSRVSDLAGATPARKNGVAPSLLYRWRKLMSEGGMVAVKSDDSVISAAEARDMKKRIRELERLLGRKTMEVEILKDALEVAREKKLISRTQLSFKDDTP
ncbi:hypothetical protein E8L03_05230 [Oceanidesulfovibrio marinus]|uniref:Transposase n=1 Tax=Oceanidesulfovibrio marinus TaxID=370038 RepID=A0ABX6NF02_9BACT|nr:hypothetical protein E8L03_05230 [Oceanidesulfovibrio marinus]